MRFDLTVNILTNFAYNKGYIRVFGGKQSRPNLHIDDMCDIYKNYRKHEGPRRIMFIRKLSNLKLSDITFTKSNSEFLSE